MMRLFIRAHDLGVKGEQAIAERLDAYGLDGVQFVSYKCLDGVAYAPGAFTGERARSVHRVLEAAGKTVPLIGAYFNPVHPDTEKITRGMAVFKEHLALAKTLGCDVVGSETGSCNGEPWIYHPQNRTEASLTQVIRVFSELCACAEENGVNVGMEGAFGHVCYDVRTLERAVRSIGSAHIRIIFDLYNYLDRSNVDRMYDILAEGLQTFGSRICAFHIKDCTAQADGTLRQCGVGQGIFDYGRILCEIRKVCPDAALVLEGTTGEDIAPAVRHLKERLA